MSALIAFSQVFEPVDEFEEKGHPALSHRARKKPDAEGLVYVVVVNCAWAEFEPSPSAAIHSAKSAMKNTPERMLCEYIIVSN
jgi:hypothetical protein